MININLEPLPVKNSLDDTRGKLLMSIIVKDKATREKWMTR